jgi:two-component system chemotaxis response regulator CheY
MPRVMIIDDARTVRRYERTLLEALRGIEVVEAQNGIEAIEKALVSPVDLFVVDVNMPKMDGHRFVSEVRQRLALRAIPIIVATTEDKPEDLARSYALGANLHLSKPFEPEKFLEAVRLLLGLSP